MYAAAWDAAIAGVEVGGVETHRGGWYVWVFGREFVVAGETGGGRRETVANRLYQIRRAMPDPIQRMMPRPIRRAMP